MTSGATTYDADVIVVGAGPTGLLLAAELALRDVDVVVLERHAARPDVVRAFNLGPRSLEILDRRGIVDRFLAEGPRVPVMGFAGLEAPLPLAGLDTDHPYVLGIAQTRGDGEPRVWRQRLLGATSAAVGRRQQEDPRVPLR